MENRNRPDTITLSAIIIGVVSLLGLCLILFINQIYQPRPIATQADTSTPFKYLFVGTEPGISTVETPTETPTAEEIFDETETTVPATEATPRHSLIVTARAGSVSSKGGSTPRSTTPSPTLQYTATPSPASPSATATMTATSPVIIIDNSPTYTPIPIGSFAIATVLTPNSALTRTPTRTSRPTFTATKTATPTFTSPPGLLPAGTYDDFESRILYIGDWVTQTGVSGAYQTTLHVSNTIGNALTFSFSGQSLVLRYQGGPSLGTVLIRIDNKQLQLDQSIANEWVVDPPTLSNGTHTVYISHIAGGSVNIDQIIIPDIATPTSTP